MGSAGVRDAPPWPDGLLRWTERHLQCVWYDDRLRPVELRTSEGERVEVVQPGSWNLEAGPDFLGAELGDVELHIRPSDWVQHRHGEDSRYAGVVLHVTFFGGAGQEPGVPAHMLRVALREPLLSRRGFSFEDIDVAAYPHAVIPSTPRPCGEALAGLAPTRWASLLEAAGRHRIRAKSARLAARIAETGDRRQVFYEECMAVLGAKRNSVPFRKVAERLPLSGWTPGGLPEEHYARLLGVAGLLPDADRLGREEARRFVRGLWDLWFRAGGGAQALDEGVAWTLTGMRPHNHPLRRLAAAAVLFSRAQEVLDELMAVPPAEPAGWARRACRIFAGVPPLPYWETRLSLDAPVGSRPVALLGEARIAALLANVVVPLKVAEDPAAELLADALPTEDLGAPAREMAYRLFGRDHNPALYAGHGVMQQGLLAIHHDFCLRIREGCDGCPLAGHLRGAWHDAR